MGSRTAGEHRVVVGVDGSDSSKDALEWAISQARKTGATVDAIITWDFPVTGWTPAVMDGQFAERAEQIMNESVHEVIGTESGVDIRRTVRCGNAAEALIDASRGADLLVVGSRGHGGFAGALLGSVGQHCAQHADCPVVIVRGKPRNGSP